MTQKIQNQDLSLYGNNIFSQKGEDGITEEILRRIGENLPLNQWCVEFGAWDGIHLSNTCNLIKNKSYNAVLIEGDSNKHKDLCVNFPSEKIHKICEFVTFEGASTLDNILARTPIPQDFDFLSIDIDGCDYYILESLVRYSPKVICIEYNPTVPNEVDFVQPRDFSIKQGSSARAIDRLAKSKGYTLVTVTDLNLIFVRNDMVKFVTVKAEDLEKLRDDSRFKVYLFVGYDGTILSNKKEIQLPWHSLNISIEHFQQLPKMFRIFPTEYNPVRSLLLRNFMTLKRTMLKLRK